jgi:hypothetical protein
MRERMEGSIFMEKIPVEDEKPLSKKLPERLFSKEHQVAAGRSSGKDSERQRRRVWA